jgi:hypothetical protein
MSDQEYIEEYGYDNELGSVVAEDEREIVDLFFAKIERQEARNTEKMQKAGF